MTLDARLGIVRLGYACICLSLGEVQYTKGTILKYAQPERLRELIRHNLSKLEPVLEFTRGIGVQVFRLSSDVVPFGGHPINEIAWWEEFGDELARLGAIIRQSGLRVSLHPGQYTVLSSPREDVVLAASRDLAYHARLLDALGTDASAKIVIHGGGVYGDKAAAIGCWLASFERLPPSVRRRLVIENDARLIDPNEFGAFLEQAPERPFDCMLEAKGKDLALLQLREQLAERRVLRRVA